MVGWCNRYFMWCSDVPDEIDDEDLVSECELGCDEDCDCYEEIK